MARLVLSREWVGNYGVYEVPQRFWDVKIRKDNWPDQRFKNGREMASQIKRLEQEAKEKYETEARL